MRSTIFLIGFLVVCNTACGDMLLFNDTTKPVYGIVEGENQKSGVKVSIYIPSEKKIEKRRFRRDRIKSITITIDKSRLANLSIENLVGFRDYAEELTSFKNDPAAQRIALRLTLLCIYQANKTKTQRAIGQSAARTLLQLAKTRMEKERFETICFLYGGCSFLPTSENENKISSEESNVVLLKVVQALRREQFSHAAKLLDAKPETENDDKSMFAANRHLLMQIAISNKMNADITQTLLGLEIAIRFPEQSTVDDSPKGSFQQEQSKRPDSETVIPTIKNIAGFDLEATTYKNGKWRRPD